MATNTGTPGFDLDGKAITFDVGDPSAEGDDPVNFDHGDIKVDDSPKDVSKKTRATLSQYLSDLTNGKRGTSKGVPNSFPIDSTIKETTIVDSKGFPSQQPESSNDKQFSSKSASSGTSLGSTTTRLSVPNVMPDVFVDPSSTLKPGLNKGKQPVSGIDGNTLLPGVQKDLLPEPIKSYVSTSLKFNRFTDSSVASPSTLGLTNDDKPGEFNAVLHHPRLGAVSMHRLAQVGTALSLRASQELNASSPGNNPTSGAQEAAALLPGGNQLGITRVNVTLLEARDVLATLTQEEVPSGDFLSIGDVSWGSLNNVDDPFSGINSAGMIALAVALSAAVVLTFEGLGTLLAMIKGSSTGPVRAVSGRYTLGSYSATKNVDPNAFPPNFPPDIGALLGIRSTVYPFGDALRAGVAKFFGINTSTLGSAVSSGITSAASSPGFNVVVARTIIRSGPIVADAFKKAFNNSNIVSGINNTLSTIEIIRSSKLIAAMNVFAQLGDSVLSEDKFSNQDALGDKAGSESARNSTIDALSNDVNASAVKKNRLKGSLKLAWSNNRSPSMYLIPGSVMSMAIADAKLGGFKGVAGLSDQNSKTTSLIQSSATQRDFGARIQYDDPDPNKMTVKKIESALDAEYVPFYFHDLRTNEVISFHAFLASLNEDYAPAWETVEGYGRVDPIKIYKNTTRRISLSFYVVATSENDFDDMWVKINKLVTLVYPQYTRGRLLTDGSDNSFVQPFSQLIGASPLIRLRLGDLLRSNYSRFALARLFGAADNVMKLDGSDVSFDSVDNQDISSVISAAITSLVSSPTSSDRFTIDAVGWSAHSDGGGVGFSVPSLPGGPAGSKPDQSSTFNIDAGDLMFFEFKIKIPGATAVVEPVLLSAADLTERFGYDAKTAGFKFSALQERYDTVDNIKQKVVGGKAGYDIPSSMLKPSKKTVTRALSQALSVSTSASQNIDKLSEFLSSENNALVKSFKSIQGKGLAGVIESMGFDWYDRVLWDTRAEHKAPKMCKVTLSFTAIHDVSPGIDSQGYNRAPIYPVGGAMGPGPDVEKGNT